MASTMSERVRAFGGMFGNLFGGSRNLYAVFGYSPSVEYNQMLAKFDRQDIAARIVEAEPRATWSNPPDVQGNETFNTAWGKLVEELQIFEKFNRLDKLAGLGRYSVLVVGYDDGADMSKPVNASKERKILYVQPYSEVNAIIQEWEDNTADMRFGLPRMYEIRTTDQTNTGLASRIGGTSKPKQGITIKPFRVHHSRILHVAENALEDPVYGYPRLKRVFNLLDDLLKVVGGSSETFWLTSNRGLQVDVDKEMDFKEDDAEALSEEIDEYMHNLRRVIRTKGVNINNLGSEVADPRGPFGVIVALISGATGIPQRILLGSEAGQLASEQDRANWATRLEERRNLFAEPIILTRFIKMQQKNNALPESALAYEWPDAFRQNPLERSQTAAQKARALSNVSKAANDPIQVITIEEHRATLGIYGEVPVLPDNTPEETEETGQTRVEPEETIEQPEEVETSPEAQA